MEELQVLYTDYNGHRRPLSLMYFSLDSRCLVADHPESVAEEVESHFCPTCNGLFTTPDAMSMENRCGQGGGWSLSPLFRSCLAALLTFFL